MLRWSFYSKNTCLDKLYGSFWAKKHIFEQQMSLSTKICNFLTKNVIFDQKKAPAATSHTNRHFFPKKKAPAAWSHTKSHFFSKKKAPAAWSHTKNIYFQKIYFRNKYFNISQIARIDIPYFWQDILKNCLKSLKMINILNKGPYFKGP